MPERPEHENRQDRAAGCSVPLTRKESWNEKPNMEKSTIKIAKFWKGDYCRDWGKEIDEAVSLDIFSW